MMNTRLHDILDGDLSEGSGEEFFELPEERHEFREHMNLREAMRLNANEGSLTSAEKADMRAGLAAAIGLPATVSAPAAVAPQGVAATAVTTGSGWYAKGLLALLLGVAIGAGLVMFLGTDKPQIVERRVGVPVQTAIPSTIPFGMPEPAAGAQCDSLVDQLRDSLKVLQSKTVKPKAKKKSAPAIWTPEDAAPGDDPTKYR